MKNKKVLIIVISILILLLAAGLIFFLAKGKKKDGGNTKNALFANTDYPCEYKMVKGGVEFTLDGSKTPGLSWEYSVDNQGIVEISPKGEEKDGKITYLVKPVGGGFTVVNFIRKDSLEGYSYNAADITFELFSLQNEDSYEITVSQADSQLSSYGVKVAEDTDYPFILVTNANDKSLIVFPHGSSDWMFEEPTGKLVYRLNNMPDGMESLYFIRDFYAGKEIHYSAEPTDDSLGTFEEIEPDTEPFETTVTFSSAKLGLTKYIKVKVSENNVISLSLTDAPE